MESQRGGWNSTLLSLTTEPGAGNCIAVVKLTRCRAVRSLAAFYHHAPGFRPKNLIKILIPPSLPHLSILSLSLCVRACVCEIIHLHSLLWYHNHNTNDDTVYKWSPNVAVQCQRGWGCHSRGFTTSQRQALQSVYHPQTGKIKKSRYRMSVRHPTRFIRTWVHGRNSPPRRISSCFPFINSQYSTQLFAGFLTFLLY